MTNSLTRVALAVATAFSAGQVRAQERSPLESVLALQQAFVESVRQAEASVVGIMLDRDGSAQTALLLNQGRVIRGGLGGGLVARQARPNLEAIKSSEFVPLAFGSGVLVDAKGLVLTNYHVVDLDDESAEPNAPPGRAPMAPAMRRRAEIYAVLTDGRVFPAGIYAADPRSDLAVLQLIADPQRPITEQPPIGGLKAMRLGDASQAKKGQFVLSLGNPFAIARDGSPSVSWGIISNFGRAAEPLPTPYGSSERSTLHHYGTLLQTDARLNLGTSGGALINLHGEMIGLTTSLAALTGYEQSAGYAIPLDDSMRHIIDTLKAGREVEYGFLGIRLGERAPDVRPGVVVQNVVPGTPASWSGLRNLDVIVEINSRPIAGNDDLVLAVGTLPAGTEVQVRVDRNGQEQLLTVPLAKYPIRRRAKIVASVQDPPWRGLRVDYPTAWQEFLSQSSPFSSVGPSTLPAGGCVLVTSVQSGSAAAKAGIEAGDLITQINGRPVRTPEEFRKAVAQVGQRGVNALIHAEGTKTIAAP